MRIDGGRADDGVAALMDEEADLLVVPGLSVVLVLGGHLLCAGDLYSNLSLANAIAGIPAQIGSPSMAERFDHPWPNSAILATESMKNTVYVKAKECTKVVSMEELVVILRRYFTSIYPQVGPPDTPAAASSPSHRTPPIYGVSHLSPGGVGIARRDGRCGVCVSRWVEGAWVGGRRACDGWRSRASGASGRGSHVVDMGCQLVECVVHRHQPRAFCAHFL